MIINYVLDIGVFRQRPRIGIFQQEDNKHLFWSLTLHASGTVLGDLSSKNEGSFPFPTSLPTQRVIPQPSSSLPATTMSSPDREDHGDDNKRDELENDAGEPEQSTSRRSFPVGTPVPVPGSAFAP